MSEPQAPSFLQGDSYPATAVYFLLGGLVTSPFSGSLDVPAVHADLPWVLAVGMIVPCFTWVVQVSASGLLMPEPTRRRYWGDLGRICLLGSFALLPAAAYNLLVPTPSWWVSAGNVLLSVFVMAADLFRRSAQHGLSMLWPISWFLTISVNMTLFYLSSRSWW